MQRRIEIYCIGKGRGEHPQRLIATLTDSRHDVGDKAASVERSKANVARLNPESSDEERRAIALGYLDAATRISTSDRKTRQTNKRAYYQTESRASWVEETRKGRYFHFRCKSCGRRGDYMEAPLTKFIDALHVLGRDSADLSELSNII
jgi:hypothetical protein